MFQHSDGSLKTTIKSAVVCLTYSRILHQKMDLKHHLTDGPNQTTKWSIAITAVLHFSFFY